MIEKKTKDRNKCGIPIHEKGDKTSYQDEFGKIKNAVFLKEKVIYDDNGVIIGVVTEWQ